MRPMIALVLRLYPARWRARYGDEFAAVLEERPLGPFDVADVLLGALDAHLHLRGLGAASQHAKGFAMSGLLAVGALLVLPALFGASGALRSLIVTIPVVAAIIVFPAGWIALGVSALRVDRVGGTHFERAIS